jgi:hypothetical protein
LLGLGILVLGFALLALTRPRLTPESGEPT